MGRPICTKPLVLTVVAISLIYSNISSTSYVLLTTNTPPQPKYKDEQWHSHLPQRASSYRGEEGIHAKNRNITAQQ